MKLTDIIAERNLTFEEKVVEFYINKHAVYELENGLLRFNYKIPRNLDIIDLSSIKCDFSHEIFFNNEKVTDISLIFFPYLPYIEIVVTVFVDMESKNDTFRLSFNHAKVPSAHLIKYDSIEHEHYTHSGGVIHIYNN